MKERSDPADVPGGPEGTGHGALSAARDALVRVVDAVERAGARLEGASDHDLVDALSALEEAKNACCAVQAHATVELRERREDQATTARHREDAFRSVVSEVALARRESPHRARTLVGLATVASRELPCTLAAMSAGRVSEWRAMLVARETACLDVEDRRAVDREIAHGLGAWSNREVAARARKAAYRLDPRGSAEHAARAASDRRVTIRPAPACMAVVSALLPVAQGVAVHAALTREAESARAAGDARGRGQIMADTLVTRVTGQSSARAVPVEVHLVLTDDALMGASETPAHLGQAGPLPAGVARELAAGGADEETHVWVRRLYARPADGRLVAMESTRRLFPMGLRRFIRARDGDECRTPWCGAPISHADHVTSVEDGGPTSVENAQGLCAHCNQAKQAPGWVSTARADGSVVLTTPTGHAYTTRPPPLPHEAPPLDSAAPAVGSATPQAASPAVLSGFPTTGPLPARPGDRARAPAA